MGITRKAFLLQPIALHKKIGTSAAEGESAKLGKEEAELRVDINDTVHAGMIRLHQCGQG